MTPLCTECDPGVGWEEVTVQWDTRDAGRTPKHQCPLKQAPEPGAQESGQEAGSCLHVDEATRVDGTHEEEDRRVKAGIPAYCAQRKAAALQK